MELTTFAVRYHVEHFADRSRIVDGYLNWMRVIERIQILRRGESVYYKLLPHVPLYRNTLAGYVTTHNDYLGEELID